MAAHVVTALRDIANLKSSVIQVQCALEYAAWADQLEFQDWSDLRECKNMEQLEKVATRLHWKYYQQWYKLDKPETYEQWIINLYEKGE